MKSESLVIADQHAAVNTFPGLVHTARHTMGVSCSRSGCANPQGRQAPKEWLVTGVKSEQGSRRGTCGWITSFLRSVEGVFGRHATNPRSAPELARAPGRRLKGSDDRIDVTLAIQFPGTEHGACGAPTVL